MFMVSAHLYPEFTLINFQLVKVANGLELRMAFQHQAWMRVHSSRIVNNCPLQISSDNSKAKRYKQNLVQLASSVSLLSLGHNAAKTWRHFAKNDRESE